VWAELLDATMASTPKAATLPLLLSTELVRTWVELVAVWMLSSSMAVPLVLRLPTALL
jgi:hypothetical protein